jgi:adenylate cyclase
LCLGLTKSLVYFSSRMVRSPIAGLENQLIDLSFQVRTGSRMHATLPIDQLVIIDIDDASIERLGRTSLWPRSYDARVIRHINAGSPYALGIDYLYTESDALPKEYERELKRQGFADASSIVEAMSTDQQLAEAMAEGGNTYLSFYDDDARADSLLSDDARTFLRILPGDSLPIQRLHYPVLPIRSFSRQAAAIGSISMPTDQDGSVRFYQALQRIDMGDSSWSYVANFPVYMLLDAYGISPDSVKATEQGLKVADSLLLPLDSDGSFRLNWLNSDDKIRYISYYKVLEGLVPSEFFENKFVFFGTSASGLQDLKTVPSQSDKMPGVEVHAIAFLNIMNRHYLKEYKEWELLPYFVLCSFVLVILFLMLRPLFGFVAAVALMAAEMFGFILYVVPVYQLVFPIVTLMALTFFAYLSTSLFIYFVRERKSRRLKSAFSTYVSPEVVEQIARDSSLLHLGGERKRLTVLFSDIRSFTSYSEKLSPEEIVAVLNDYLSRMSSTIFKQKGTIDKFIGDAIMAIFGAPIPQKDHAHRACVVALEMMKELALFNAQQRELGAEELQIGIGLNTGDMTVGNIGSEKRFDYTVIGDAVNLGSRLESLTKKFGVNIIISEFTLGEINSDAFFYRELGSVIVKGRDGAVRVFELMDYSQSNSLLSEALETWRNAVSAFQSQQFETASTLFEKFLVYRPGDEAAQHYRQKCDRYKQFPDEYTWIIRMESK